MYIVTGLTFVSFIFIFIFSFVKMPKEIQCSFEVCMLFLISVIASSRGFFITQSDDMLRYYDAYLLASKYNFIDYLFITEREPFFELYTWLISNLISDQMPVNAFCFFLVFPTVTFLYIFYKKLSRGNPSFAFMCLLTPNLLLIETQLVRQAMGYAIFMFAITRERRNLKLILFFLAVMVHATSFVFVLIWLFGNKVIIPLARYSRGFIFFPTIIFSFILGTLIKKHYATIVDVFISIPYIGYKANYLKLLEFDSMEFSILIKIFFLSLAMLLSIVFFNYNSKCISENKINIHVGDERLITFIFLMACLVLLFSGMNQLAERFFSLIYSSLPVIFLNFLFYFKMKLYQAKIVKLFIILFFVAYFLVNATKAVDTPFPMFNGFLASPI